MPEFIRYHYAIETNTKGEVLDEAALTKRLKSDKLGWVHLNANDPMAREWLHEHVSYLDVNVLEALFVTETRPRIAEYDDGLLLVLRGVNLNENANPEDMVSLRLWVDRHRIISVSRRQLRALDDVAQHVEAGKVHSSGDFVCTVISKLFERMEPTLQALDDQTDEAEEQVIEKADIVLRESLTHIRKKAIALRRYMAPQKEAIGQLRYVKLSWFEDRHRRNLQENHDRITRYVEDLDTMRERAQIIKDELAALLADAMNKNMYLLSVIAAIFLPLGFLTGLLGINVGGIPGADNGDAFFFVCGVMGVIVVGQILWFRSKKWF